MNGGTMQQQQQQHFDAEINEINLAHSYSDDKSGTTFTKKAVLLPFIATTLSPLSSPQTSPITSSTSFTTLGHFQSTSPFFKLSATYSSSKSLATCSSSLYFLSSNLTNTSSSFSSLSSFIDTLASKQQTLRCLSSSDMTVAKLEPSSGDSINSISPPESPLTLKKDVYSSSVSPSATSTTTTTRITSSKNISSTTTDSKRDDSVDNDSAKKPPRKLGPKMNPVYKFLRAFAWAMYFDLGATLISMTQVLSLPLTLIAPGVYYRHIKRTAGHFGAFLLRMNQLFAPSDIILTGDESVKGIIKVYQGKHLKGGKDGEAASKHKADETLLDMPDRLVLISNHQIYSDWMYLWCFSYLAEKHRALKIILRGDLTWIPVFGWVGVPSQGMRFFDFILLKRNDFEHDKRAIEQNLKRAAKDEPLWLVVFPEGTVVSKGTRKRSQTFAEKAGLTDHRHVLLPRTSGLFICINELRGSVEYVYDTTVGYSGIHYGEIPQELYPLPGLYINKAQPKEINMHLRRFAVKDIPSTEPEFIEWVRARWIEKDELMEVFYKTGKFPSQFTSEDIGGDSSEDTDIKGGVSIRLPLKSRSMLDYLSPSAIVVIALPVIAYAALKYF